MIRRGALIGLIFILSGLNATARRTQFPPSLEFGSAQISVGMTREQVEAGLRHYGRHLVDMQDKHTAVVREDNAPVPTGDEGEVMFFDGRVAYAAIHLPVARNAAELAQEVAGAVENMQTKTCAVRNYTSHGTGGGFSQTIFDCGSKSFDIMTVEALGTDERYSNVEITVGEIPSPSK